MGMEVSSSSRFSAPTAENRKFSENRAGGRPGGAAEAGPFHFQEGGCCRTAGRDALAVPAVHWLWPSGRLEQLGKMGEGARYLFFIYIFRVPHVGAGCSPLKKESTIQREKPGVFFVSPLPFAAGAESCCPRVAQCCTARNGRLAEQNFSLFFK